MARFLARERRAQLTLREGACSLISTSQPASCTLTEVTIRLKERVLRFEDALWTLLNLHFD